jgi:hypothetical protein
MNAAHPPVLDRAVPAALLRWEGVLVCLVAWACFLAIPLSLGELGLSWDALNHQIYLGWTAEQNRFDLDFLGAGYQSFTSPYLYWPVYKMAASGWSGMAAGAVLASLHVIVVWPVWKLACACLPGGAVFDLAMRALAMALAFLSAVVLSAFGCSMNDLLAAAPLVWAVALAIDPATQAAALPPAVVRRDVLLSGLCAGLAVALKLSNGPLALCLPGLWLLCGRDLRSRLGAALLGSAGTVAGFMLGYGAWGWQLWRHFGNPVFPFYDPWFAPLRALVGWVG